MINTWNYGQVNQPTIDELATQYVFGFPNDPDAVQERWNIYLEMQRRFSFDQDLINQSLRQAYELADMVGFVRDINDTEIPW